MNEGVNVMKKDESDSSHALFEITGWFKERNEQNFIN